MGQKERNHGEKPPSSIQAGKDILGRTIYPQPQENSFHHLCQQILLVQERFDPGNIFVTARFIEQIKDLNKVPVAAVPLPGIEGSSIYAAVFGRDSLHTAADFLDLDPQIMEQTLKYLAIFQGTVDEDKINLPNGEEEKGRFPHEIRDEHEERATSFVRERQWHFPYYGNIDTNPLYLLNALRYCEEIEPGFIEKTKAFSGNILTKQNLAFNYLTDEVIAKDGHKKTMAEAFMLGLDWILSRMEQNDHKIIECHPPHQKACQFQCWRDSYDSVLNPDESIASGIGFAGIEIHALSYEALQASLHFLNFFEQLNYQQLRQLFPNERFDLNRLKNFRKTIEKRMTGLQKFIKEKMVVEKEGQSYLALASIYVTNQQGQSEFALDKRLASSQGWLLNSDLLDCEKDQELIKNIIRSLYRAEMLHPFGIRTLGTKESSYDSRSYHNGSVWAMDNCQILRGLLKQGYYGLAHDLALRIIAQANHLGFFPEFIQGKDTIPPQVNMLGGEDENEHMHSQPLQAWTISAVFFAKRVLSKMGKGELPKQAASNTSSRELEDEILTKINENELAKRAPITKT